MEAWRNLRSNALQFWQARNGREQAMLLLAAAVVLLGLIYALLIDPAIRGRAQLNKSLPELRQQAATLQALAKESAGLSGKAAAPAAPMTRESVEGSLQRRGITPQNVAMTGELARVQISSAPFSGLVDWLAENQKSARITVVEATVNSLPTAGMVNATLTLRQQKGE